MNFTKIKPLEDFLGLEVHSGPSWKGFPNSLMGDVLPLMLVGIMARRCD